MNIIKDVKTKGNHEKTLISFHPNIIFLHVVISSVIQFGMSIQPVALYEYYLICIFMKTRKMRGKVCKKHRPVGGRERVGWLVIRPPLHP